MSKDWMVWQHPALGGFTGGHITELFGTKQEAKAFLAGMRAAKNDPHEAGNDFRHYSVEPSFDEIEPVVDEPEDNEPSDLALSGGVR